MIETVKKTRTQRERQKRKERKRERDGKPCLNKSSVLSTLILFISFYFTSSDKYLHCLPPCQPVNIIQPSAGNTFQSPSDDRSCQSPSELQIQAIWEHSRHVYWTSADSFTKFCKFIKFPSIIRGERESATAEWRCVYAGSCHFLRWLVWPYVVHK